MVRRVRYGTRGWASVPEADAETDARCTDRERRRTDDGTETERIE